MGTQTKCNLELAEEICKRIEMGHATTAAGRAAGVPDITMAVWKRRGREEPGTIYAQFLERIQIAEGVRTLKMEEDLSVFHGEDPRVIMWRLERTDPTYNLTRQVEMSASLDIATREASHEQLQQLSVDELKQLQSLHEKVLAAGHPEGDSEEELP